MRRADECFDEWAAADLTLYDGKAQEVRKEIDFWRSDDWITGHQDPIEPRAHRLLREVARE